MKAVISADMKEQNRRVVYEAIRRSDGQSFTRAGISRAAGISGPTVLKIVGFFEERGLIAPCGSSAGGEPGRRASLYRFRPDAACAAGASYDGSALELSLIDLNYRTVRHTRLPLRADFSALIGETLPRELPRFLQGKENVLGVGVSLPAAVDPERRRVSCPAFPAVPSAPEGADLSDACAALEKAAGIPVLLENDVNAAAKAEFRARGMSDGDDLIYLMLGGGVGAGIILDGKLRRGRNFSCGEVGYMVWDPAFRTDRRQSGYLEWQLYRYPLDRFGVDLLSPGDAPLPYALTEHIATQLALAAADLSNSLDVQTFVLGGSVSRRMGFTLTQLVNRKLQALSLNGASVCGPLCEDACSAGAASLALDRRLDRLLED